MARIRSRDTKPELRVRSALHAAGLRYVLHDRRLPGTPDVVFPSRRLAIHVHGCFWHQHPGCLQARMPKSRQDFWPSKLMGNAQRDARKDAELKAAGWEVITVWECETRDAALISALVQRVKDSDKLPKFNKPWTAEARDQRVTSFGL
jgi:DNA mismatch endonuclease (patch repair protein)